MYKIDEQSPMATRAALLTAFEEPVETRRASQCNAFHGLPGGGRRGERASERAICHRSVRTLSGTPGDV